MNPFAEFASLFSRRDASHKANSFVIICFNKQKNGFHYLHCVCITAKLEYLDQAG